MSSLRHALVLAALTLASCGSTTTTAPAEAPECAAQLCRATGDCDAVLGDGKWTWDGATCVPYYSSGCGLEGPDCARLFDSEPQCAAEYAQCPAP